MTEGPNPVRAKQVVAADKGGFTGPPKPEKSFIEKYIYDSSPSGEGTLESIFSPSRASITPEAQIAKINAGAADKLALATDPAQKAAIKAGIDKQIAEIATAGDPSFLTKAAPSLYAAGAAGTGIALAGAFKDSDEDGMDDSTGLTLDEYKTQYPDRFFGPGFYGDNPYYQDPTFLNFLQHTQQGVGQSMVLEHQPVILYQLC